MHFVSTANNNGRRKTRKLHYSRLPLLSGYFITQILSSATVAPHGDNSRKYQIDRFVHYTICGFLATRQTGRKRIGKTEAFYIVDRYRESVYETYAHY
jgi:hypothetical protein